MQDPADRSGGEESCTERFVGGEGVGDFQDAGRGTFTTRFGLLAFFQALMQVPSGGIDLPGRNENLELFHDAAGLPHRFACSMPVALGHGEAGLQVPCECLQVGISGGER